MYQEQETVLVRRYQWSTSSQEFDEHWHTGTIVKCLGKTKMRTGIARFEERIAFQVSINGKIETVHEQNLKKIAP